MKDGENYPGPRHGHVAVVYDRKMYLFGGKVSSMGSTNQTNVYDFETGKWIKTQVSGTIPSNIDSHSAVVSEGKMYVFGGFLSVDNGSYSNQIFVLDLEKLEWSRAEPSNSKLPAPRANSSLGIVDGCLYVFGGSNLDEKMKDLWKFHLATRKWEFINTNQNSLEMPVSRAGHTLTAYNNKLVLFGGIQNITHEKDDIFVFDVVTQKWKLIDNGDTRQSQIETLLNDEN